MDSNSPDDPYLPPESRETGPPCPRCGEPMESGRLRSGTNILWLKDEAGFYRRWIRGGIPLGKIRTAAFGIKLPARHCPTCRIFQLD